MRQQFINFPAINLPRMTMRIWIRCIPAIVAIVLLSSCNQEEKITTDDDKPAAPAPQAVQAVAETPFEVSLTPANILKGKTLYQTNCAPCHGVAGKGDGPGAVALNPKPRDHSNGAYMDKLTNRHIHDVIKNGGLAFGFPTMPGQPQLSDNDIAQVIAFIRTLSNTYKPGTTYR